MKVYSKGEVNTPGRFYKYLLCKSKKQEKEAISLGFNYSKSDTEDYLKLSKEERNKIAFYQIPDWKKKLNR